MKRKTKFTTVFILLGIFLTVSLAYSFSMKAQEKVKEAIAMYKKGEYDSAVGALKSAIRIDPIYPESYYWLGKVYLKKSDKDKAIKYAKKAYSLNRHEPKYKDLLSEIDFQEAVSLYSNGNKEAAYQKVEAILEDNSLFLLGYEFLVKYYLQSGDYDKALQVIRKVQNFVDTQKIKDSDPKYIDIVAYKAFISFKKKQYARAIIEINRLSRYKKTSPKVSQFYELIFSDKNLYYSNLKKGKGLFKEKKFLEAKKYFQIAAKYDVSGEAKSYLSKIESYEKAKGLYQKAVEDFKSKKYKEALQKIDEANSFYYLDESKDLLSKINKILSKKQNANSACSLLAAPVLLTGTPSSLTRTLSYHS
jgi:tetratricopeptide (TPR) repeat protein